MTMSLQFLQTTWVYNLQRHNKKQNRRIYVCHLVLFQFSFLYNVIRKYCTRTPPSFMEYYLPDPELQHGSAGVPGRTPPPPSGIAGVGASSSGPGRATAVCTNRPSFPEQLTWQTRSSATLESSTVHRTRTAERCQAKAKARSRAGTRRPGLPHGRRPRRVDASQDAHREGHKGWPCDIRCRGQPRRGTHQRVDRRHGQGPPPGLFRPGPPVRTLPSTPLGPARPDARPPTSAPSILSPVSFGRAGRRYF